MAARQQQTLRMAQAACWSLVQGQGLPRRRKQAIATNQWMGGDQLSGGVSTPMRASEQAQTKGNAVINEQTRSIGNETIPTKTRNCNLGSSTYSNSLQRFLGQRVHQHAALHRANKHLVAGAYHFRQAIARPVHAYGTERERRQTAYHANNNSIAK